MNFICPHCGARQIVTDACKSQSEAILRIGRCAQIIEATDSPHLGASLFAIRCANDECNKPTVHIELGSCYLRGGYPHYLDNSEFFTARVYPHTSGKPFPPSVPERFLQDYNESWAIIDLSPKSSATLARRCLQGMIRDFCGIHERTLFQEIQTLEKKLQTDELPKGVEPETIEAMRALKDVGNIGAHMTEVDGVIVDVEPGEAEALLGLIEMLFNDWYVARAKRQQRLAEIVALAEAKKNPPAPNPA